MLDFRARPIQTQPTPSNAGTEQLVRWHRAWFRSYWRWKSRNRGGRPQIDTDLRALIGQMSLENPLWGAPRIHGELLKLGFEVSQSTVAKYMPKRRDRPARAGGPSSGTMRPRSRRWTCSWGWKSRTRKAGRPQVSLDIRRLIREMSLANPLWECSRIHG